jgi:hypothetical protein
VVANAVVRNWGHQFIYDEPTRRQTMDIAGFANVESYPIMNSGDPRRVGLENVERMPPGLLQLFTMTLEGVKPIA